MPNSTIKKLMIDIPTKFCRSMNQKFVDTILKKITDDFSRHHFMILKLLNEMERLYITEIVDILSITKSQMTASVDKLVELGYVSRIQDKNDRRKNYLTMTPKGVEITRTINHNIEIQIDENLARLSQKELEDLEAGLKVIHKFCSLCSE